MEKVFESLPIAYGPKAAQYRKSVMFCVYVCSPGSSYSGLESLCVAEPKFEKRLVTNHPEH